MEFEQSLDRYPADRLNFDLSLDIRKLREEGLSLNQIAEQIGSNFESVRKICHKEGIIKPRSIDKRLSPRQKLSFKIKYLSGDCKNDDLAKIFGISLPSVKRLAKRMNLPLKYSLDYPKRKKLMEQSAELYKKGLSTWQIKKKLGIHDETIRGYLIKLGIRRRYVNGLSKRKITLQNKIIKEMYLNGNKLEEIEKAVKLGTHGIEKRLKSMGIERNRNPYNPVGNVYDVDIKTLYLSGKNIVEIAELLKLTTATAGYRLKKHIFNDNAFKILYYSKLSNRWKRTTKTYATLREVEFGKRRIRKYIGQGVYIKINAIEPRVRPKLIDLESNFYSKISNERKKSSEILV